MKFSCVSVTVVEHQGRTWLVESEGRVIAEVQSRPGQCDHIRAAIAVHDILDSERRRDQFCQDAKEDRDLRERWDQSIANALVQVQGSRYKLSESNDAWNRRIDSAAKACYLMVKRGSNLRGNASHGGLRSWGQFYSIAYRRSMQWNSVDQWEGYSSNLASNLRKRFRNTGS